MELLKEDWQTTPVLSDEQLLEKHLPTTDGALWIELGCGDASAAKKLADSYPHIHIQAFEVDAIQHEKNLANDSSKKQLDNLTFGVAGMQDTIPVDDVSADAVFMLKSLHHVPGDQLEQGFAQVHRVLKPGGILFVSEPIFANDPFSGILRIFHNEQGERKRAFEAIQHSVENGMFRLKEEIHHQWRLVFPNGWADFQARMLGQTHTHFHLTDDMMKQVQAKVEENTKGDGSAEFLVPMRVDVLVKI
jgi:ubiquinone/menaquinone biosynthesis C-methylase UbiE